ncbi:aspartate--tRNA ligase [Trifolium repens]|nr:aspartate--tRNA ligase [Trifolium repens]
MAAATTAVSNLSLNEVPFATNYGDILLVELQSKTIVDVNEWTLVKNLDDSERLEGIVSILEASIEGTTQLEASIEGTTQHVEVKVMKEFSVFRNMLNRCSCNF